MANHVFTSDAELTFYTNFIKATLSTLKAKNTNNENMNLAFAMWSALPDDTKNAPDIEDEPMRQLAFYNNFINAEKPINTKSENMNIADALLCALLDEEKNNFVIV
jgi:hypothetical protein